MKKQANPKPITPSEGPLELVKSAPKQEVIEPSELALWVPNSPTSGFEPLPKDSTLAMPSPELNPAKTAGIPPALLSDAHSESGQKARGSWKLRLGAGILAMHLITGVAIWYLWPKFRPKTKEASSAAAQVSAPAAPEAVPPELRPYMQQAKDGDAKAMHLIALMYWNGLNVQQDRVKGLEWYRKAAAAGDLAAQKELSVIDQK